MHVKIYLVIAMKAKESMIGKFSPHIKSSTARLHGL